MKVEVSNFESEVLDASREGPVLVDFWAPWCGPCRQLGPVLERMADEPEAGFTLAKVNTDVLQTVAAKYNIRSIPAVKLFVDGEVTDEFLGALPEAQVRKWLADALPSENRQLLADARAALDAGDTATGEALLEQVLAAEPANAEAAVLLGKTILFKDPVRASSLATEAARTTPAVYDLASAVKTITALISGEECDLPDEPARAPYLEALQVLSNADIDAALGSLIASVRLNKRFADDAARKACLALFAYLGSQDPLTQKHRRALEKALF
jgi:putative thioredoxin